MKQGVECKDKKVYIKLLAKAAVDLVKRVDAYFFGEDGEDGELRVWYYGTTAFSIGVAFFIYVMM
ncbi:hypothetical protein FH508_0014935 [Lysinibacillus sp. CD3-6]|uniref:hypothetical protein n=1 Tax=Lysinibacillus sp. CD3-6 TaxID=2892541 RepID=UPI001169B23C|nr:hypothetical protein [Lysinibacillus sp. CD3-6]UED78747.1 hypothetical protein FH508_0014935 [Lysinibacillus sp. CD3-6]